MTSAAIYARVSSARQKEQETIVSQTQALRAHAGQLGLDVPQEWVFEDDGYSGASLVRPALEALRDLVAQVPVDVVLCYSPDRLARKYAYQALLMEELARAGTSVVFVKAPSGESPEDALLVQFQGMIAEYERAQIMERTRRGKNQRARSGSVNVLPGAPFGYRYVRKSDHAAARYEIVPHEAAIVAGLFRRYADEGVAIAELARWLDSTGVITRTGKTRWDRSTIWGMLRNPAYAGRACFGKTGRLSQQAGRNRVARLAGRATGNAYTTVDRPRSDWLEIDVPALVDEATFERVARRLADNKKFASRASKTPSLLQGLAACAGCGYACYRGHTTTTAGNKIFYYRCIGSDNYRFEHGKVCGSKPVRADYLDQVVWDHITHLIADPALIRAEIDKRLAQIRTADPATAQRKRLHDALAKTTSAITRLIGAYQEDLLSLDELRARMPDLRARETSLRHQAQALDAQLADREVYLKLAGNLEGFLATLRESAVTATAGDRQRVVRLLVKEVLIGPGKIVIRHSIPTRDDTPAPAPVSTDSDDDAEPAPSSHLRWRSQVAALRNRADIIVACPGRLAGLIEQAHCHLGDVEISVVDEADHMADLGFLPVVRRLREATPPEGQRMLFSATLDHAVDVLARRFLNGLVEHAVDPVAAPAAMVHHLLTVAPADRVSVVAALVRGNKRSLVFTRTKHGAQKLARQLAAAPRPVW
jgi:site-specific DNA recombinase